MKDLFLIGIFNENGEIERFDRKGRSNAITGYDNISSAKRGLGQSKAYAHESQKHLYKIVKASNFEVVE